MNVTYCLLGQKSAIPLLWKNLNLTEYILKNKIMQKNPKNKWKTKLQFSSEKASTMKNTNRPLYQYLENIIIAH